MAIQTTAEQIADFQQYALFRVGCSGEDFELDQLLLEWYDQRQQENLDGIIRKGLSNMENGLGKPASEVTREIIKRLGLS